jgi:Uncharacterized conserved protein
LDLPFRSKQRTLTYLWLVLGAFILALGYTYFMAPYKIVPGGIYGISIVLHHKFGFPIGLAALCFNLPLAIIGLKVLGSQFGFKTFLCFFLVAGFTDGLRFVFGADPFSLHEEVLLASVFGGVVMGIGVGLILKARASSGGTDVLSAILNKYTHLPTGQLQMIIDSCIVIVGLIAFKDWKIPFYSWITIFLMGRMIDMVLQGFSNEKTLFIVSEKSEEIRRFIIEELKRGGSLVPIRGMYNFAEKDMIMTVVNRREMIVLQQAVFRIDADAFVTILEAKEIYGRGFKQVGM